MSKNYEQKKNAIARYLAKLDEIKIRLQSGEKDTIKAHAEKQGESVNAFIQRAIKEAIDRDNA